MGFQTFECDSSAPFAQLGMVFAKALSSGDYAGGFALLAPHLQSELTLEGLTEAFDQMIEYGDGPVTHLEIITTLSEWPAKQAGDVGWVYVAMTGDGFSEAVACVVAGRDSELVIREVEWGRP